MSNWSEQGIIDALASRNKDQIAAGKKALREWLASDEPDKIAAAARISAQVIDAGIRFDEQQASEKRKSEIFGTFFAAHPELAPNQANRNIFESFLVNNYGGSLTLDTLELAAEQLSGSLAKQHVPAPELTPEQKLRAKLNAQRMRETWLRTLSRDELQRVIREEEIARKRGHGPLVELQLTESEKQLLENQPKASTNTARCWLPGSQPRREPTRKEILQDLSASQIRALLCDGGGRLDWQKQARLNEIISGAPPETQTA